MLTIVGLTFACQDEEQTDESDDEVGDGDGDSDTGGPPPSVCKSSCQACENLSKDAYSCATFVDDEPDEDFECIVCADDLLNAIDACETGAVEQNVPTVDVGATLVACDEMQTATCTGWDPSSEVSFDGTLYQIDDRFVEGLISDPSQLVECDRARLVRITGGYEVNHASSGDLIWELGLRSGDVPYQLNGYPLTTPFEVGYAFWSLWGSATTFALSVDRGGGSVTLVYSLI